MTHMTRAQTRRGARGFTLVELLTAMSIFLVVSTIALSVFINVYSANRSTDAERVLMDEASFVQETIVKDVRNGVIDYPEYWRWTRKPIADPTPPLDGIRESYLAYVTQSTDALPGLAAVAPDVGLYQEAPGLVILSPEGDTRLRFWRSEEDRTPFGGGDPVTEGVLLVARERLVRIPSGTANSPSDDPWYWIDADATECDATDLPPIEATDARCLAQGRPFSSDKINVRELSFTLSPTRDPFFAYDDTTVQIQPSVSVRITMELSATVGSGRTTTPSVTLQTTSSIRSYSTVAWQSPDLLTP